MRQVIDGNGNDSTATVLAALRAGNEFQMADLFLIGQPEDPLAVRLTNWPSPLVWRAWGTFNPTSCERTEIESKVGLELLTMDFKWRPPLGAFTKQIQTTSPYQLAQMGFFDNRIFRCWTTYMPTAGDADTWGASALFGGRIGKATVTRGEILFNARCFLDLLDVNVPSVEIELLNTLAANQAATPPAGLTVIPQFNIIAGSSSTVLIADCTTPSILHHIFATNALADGFVVFNTGGGNTMSRVWSTIASNKLIVVGGNNYNQIVLYNPLPWDPTPGADTFYASAKFPINQADGQYYGFPYVPAPEEAI